MSPGKSVRGTSGESIHTDKIDDDALYRRTREFEWMTLSFFYFQLCATLGTTGACAFDNLRELGPICE
jgi:hypothetical protein